MATFFRKLARQSKGMEAIQAVLLLAVAFFAMLAMKDIGTKAQTQTGTDATKLLGQ